MQKLGELDIVCDFVPSNNLSLSREILIEESNVQRVDPPVTVSDTHTTQQTHTHTHTLL